MSLSQLHTNHKSRTHRPPVEPEPEQEHEPGIAIAHPHRHPHDRVLWTRSALYILARSLHQAPRSARSIVQQLCPRLLGEREVVRGVIDTDDVAEYVIGRAVHACSDEALGEQRHKLGRDDVRHPGSQCQSTSNSRVRREVPDKPAQKGERTFNEREEVSIREVRPYM